MRQIWVGLVVVGLWATVGQAAVRVIAGGQPVGVVVVPAEPLPVVRYAAEELVYHLQKISGATLPLRSAAEVTPGPQQIWVGVLPPGGLPGFDPASLGYDACRLQTVDGRLYLYGRDTAGPPLDISTGAGTLMGVYELLASRLGVRWLWPGELGIVAPPAAEVTLPDENRTWTPQLINRQMRAGLSTQGDVERGFTAQGRRDYAQAQAVFLRRQRQGKPLALKYGHAFESWWARYGDEHPEWFQLLPNGKRGPDGVGRRTSMCVSDPGFINQVVETWRTTKAEGVYTNLNGCENDIHGLCTCENCLAWDGPQPDNLPARFGPRMVSDRYARFWLTAQQQAAQEDPDAFILGYAYVNYAPPPTSGIKLNDHIWIGTVPDVFFPRKPAEQQWVKDQWAGWAKTGCKLFLRPNYTLDGYCMPHVYPHQWADEFSFEAARGMIFTDFDSLTGQWSTQGPNLYAMLRLQHEPTANIDDVLAEYYGGFGEAAAAVQAYWEFWEHHAMTWLLEKKDAGRMNWATYALSAPEHFPLAAFDEGDRLLAVAAAQATTPVTQERVAWLQRGLAHARLCREVVAAIQGTGGSYRPTYFRDKIAELVAFRHEHEGENLANFDFLSRLEGRSWKIPDTYSGEPLRPVNPQGGAAPAVDEAPILPLRGQVSLVAQVREGEPFLAQLRAQKVGNQAEPMTWALFDPSGRRADDGEVPLGTTAEIFGTAGEAGTWILLIDTRFSAGVVKLLNDRAVLARQSPGFIAHPARLWFMVPTGQERVTLKLHTDAPGETAKFTLRNPQGEAVWTDETGPVKDLDVDVPVPAGQAGQPWSIEWEKASTGVLEDVTVTTGDGIPAYFAPTADQLLTPVG